MTAADLTDHQREFLCAMTRGLTGKQLAAEFGLSHSGVTNLMTRIRRRIGIRTNFQLGAWCERHGIWERK